MHAAAGSRFEVCAFTDEARTAGMRRVDGAARREEPGRLPRATTLARRGWSGSPRKLASPTGVTGPSSSWARSSATRQAAMRSSSS